MVVMLPGNDARPPRLCLAGRKGISDSIKEGGQNKGCFLLLYTVLQKALDYAAEALSYFNDVFGEYPYPGFRLWRRILSEAWNIPI